MKSLQNHILEKLILNKNISSVNSSEEMFNQFLEDHNIKFVDSQDVTYTNTIIVHNRYTCPSKLLNKMRKTFKNINRAILTDQIKKLKYGSDLTNEFAICKSTAANFYIIELSRKWQHDKPISITMYPRQDEKLILQYDQKSKYPVFDLFIVFIKYLLEE